MALDNTDGNGFTLSPNNTNDNVELYEYITQRIWMICPPITLVFGTTGNILSGKRHLFSPHIIKLHGMLRTFFFTSIADMHCRDTGK